MKLQQLLAMLTPTTTVPAMAAPFFYSNDDAGALVGKVTWQTFFGTPNFGEQPETDSRETQTIVHLEMPI